MELSDNQISSDPPSLVGSLTAGFDTIANHIGLIVFPIILDLFLWIGPRLRLEALVKQLVQQLPKLAESNSVELEQSLKLVEEIWLFLAERFNIFSAIRSYPVGIPSLMALRQPLNTPIGTLNGWDLHSFPAVVGFWLLISLVGVITGTFYYVLVAQTSLTGGVQWRIAMTDGLLAVKEVLLLTLFLAAFLFALAIPVSCIVSFVSMNDLAAGQIVSLVLGGLLVWILFPLFFSAHGIFVFRQGMWISVRRGATLSRLTFLRTGLLFIVIILISEGFNTLWNVPAETSWLTMIGVIGHAFISTSLLAASFIYYRDASRWIQRLVQQAALSDKSPLRSKLS